MDRFFIFLIHAILTLIAVSTYTDNSNNNEVKYKYIPKKKFRVVICS